MTEEEDKKEKMEYNFCKHCPHADRIYLIGGGLILVCRITGNKLKITECTE